MGAGLKRAFKAAKATQHTPLKPSEMSDFLRKHSFTQGGATRVHLREIARWIEDVRRDGGFQPEPGIPGSLSNGE